MNERREQIACSGNEGATMGQDQKGHVRNQVIQEDAKVCQMSTFLRQKRLNLYGHIGRREEGNITLKKNEGHGFTREEKKRAA